MTFHTSNMRAFFVFLVWIAGTAQALIPYPSSCPNGHVCPSYSWGAIDPEGKPYGPGYFLALAGGVMGGGRPMSIRPDTDTFEGPFSITGNGAAPVTVTMKVGCSNTIIPDAANAVAARLGYNWDKLCIVDALQIAVNRALDVNNFTLTQVTSDRGPVERAIYDAMLNHTKTINCKPGEYFNLHSCNVINVQHLPELAKLFQEKVQEQSRKQLLDIKHENSKTEEKTRSAIADAENARTIEKAKSDAAAQSLINEQVRNNTQLTNAEKEKHTQKMQEILGASVFSDLKWSDAVQQNSGLLVAQPHGNGNTDGQCVHLHTAATA